MTPRYSPRAPLPGLRPRPPRPPARRGLLGPPHDSHLDGPDDRVDRASKRDDDGHMRDPMDPESKSTQEERERDERTTAASAPEFRDADTARDRDDLLLLAQHADPHARTLDGRTHSRLGTGRAGDWWSGLEGSRSVREGRGAGRRTHSRLGSGRGRGRKHQGVGGARSVREGKADPLTSGVGAGGPAKDAGRLDPLTSGAGRGAGAEGRTTAGRAIPLTSGVGAGPEAG